MFYSLFCLTALKQNIYNFSVIVCKPEPKAFCVSNASHSAVKVKVFPHKPKLKIKKSLVSYNGVSVGNEEITEGGLEAKIDPGNSYKFSLCSEYKGANVEVFFAPSYSENKTRC